MAVRETHNDTLQQRDESQQLELTIPDSLTGNALSRRVFHNRPGDTALELLDAETDTITYLLPWGSASGQLAGYRQDPRNYEVQPVELTAETVRELFNRHIPREVDLLDTPAWLLDERPRDAPRVSWHARVRYAERVEAMADPAKVIRESYAQAGHVGTDDYDRTLYDARRDLMLLTNSHTASFDVATVFPPDDTQYSTQHWRDCNDCGTAYDPSRHEGCPYHAGGRT